MLQTFDNGGILKVNNGNNMVKLISKSYGKRLVVKMQHYGILI